MPLHSYKSRFYPGSRNAFRIRQEYAVKHYGWLASVLLIVLLYLINHSQAFIWVGIVGGVVCLGFANVLAGISMRRHYAEIFFVNEQFCLLSVYDLVYDQPQQAFPVVYGSPQQVAGGIQLNYHDRVVTLQNLDWSQMPEIWQRFWIAQANDSLTVAFNEPFEQS